VSALPADAAALTDQDGYRTTYDDEPATATAPPEFAGRAPDAGERGYLPGEVGIWVFVLGDMLAFALFFGVFVHERGGDAAAFDRSRAHLTIGFAVANTILLLTSSWLVALGVRALRGQQRDTARRLITLAMLCGAAFVANKGVEYHQQLSAGRTPAGDDFFMYFFMLTGVHLAHVVIGLVVLGYLWRMTRRPAIGAGELRAAECGASYWHMVDLLWIVLFPLLYLMA
jgi:nitric oxide reductase NorE protein